MRFAPNIDGYFLPERSGSHLRRREAKRRPPAGRLEHGRRRLRTCPRKDSAAALKETAQKEFGDKADEFLKLYPAETDEQAARSLADFAGDRFIAFSTWKWLEAQNKTGKSPVYRYRFDILHPRRSQAPAKRRRLPLRRNRICLRRARFRRLGQLAPRRPHAERADAQVLVAISPGPAIPTAPVCRNGRSTIRRPAGK